MTARWLAAWLLAVLVSVALAGVALSHDFYPIDCCSNRDCEPLSGSRVRVLAWGYVVDGRFTVPSHEARRSPDGRYHGCFPKSGELRCFWAPPMSW